jgi:large conductance mechanosensitive channel
MSRVMRCCGGFCKDFKAYVFLLIFFCQTISQFDRFALRGNIVDLAIGIIIGTAFTTVVQSLVDDIITPPLGLLLGGVDFVNLTIKMKNFVYEDQPPVVIRYGKFIQAMISLIIVAFALFFVIKMINKLQKMSAKSKEQNERNIEIEVTEEVKVLREIRDVLTRQSYANSSLSNQL